MKNLIIILVAMLTSGCLLAAEPEFSNMDKAILKEKLGRFASDKSLPVGDLVLKIGLDFLNTPYVGKTLDKTKEEKLVVNLHQLDCTTFAETCLAMARTVKSSHPGPEQYCAELEGIRYRGGRLEGYASRLHYFCEWILDNVKRGLVRSVAASMGGTQLPVSLSYMSGHPSEYPQLVNDPETTAKIRAIEKEVSSAKFFYIPSEKFESVEKQVKDGDIVTLTTSIPGIDVSHVGILLWKDGKVHMLHASSTIQKVVVTTEPFAQYLAKSKKTTGIMIARPLEP